MPFETRGPSFVSKVPLCVEHVSQHKCVNYQGHTHAGATITGLPAPGLGPESLFSPLQTGQSQGSRLGSLCLALYLWKLRAQATQDTLYLHNSLHFKKHL